MAEKQSKRSIKLDASRFRILRDQGSPPTCRPRASRRISSTGAFGDPDGPARAHGGAGPRRATAAAP